ncbi:MAG: hypothetical protein J0H51_10550, partial [Rhizobiales bacterium]|nr:hypothetical protein [Hyphomicrobiales bacterium]
MRPTFWRGKPGLSKLANPRDANLRDGDTRDPNSNDLPRQDGVNRRAMLGLGAAVTGALALGRNVALAQSEGTAPP